MTAKPQLADFERAKNKAEEILKENYILTPPVNPFEISQNYGLSVFVAVFKDNNIAGYFSFPKKEIYVNAGDPIYRQTFTLAHELGHLFLEHNKDISGDVDILFRKPLGEMDNNWIEQEANCFAASLLVPQDMLEKQLKLLTGLDEIARIEKLAEIFKVSKQVINYRLSKNYA